MRKRLLTIKTRNMIRWNISRDNNYYSRRQVLRVKCFWKPDGYIKNLADINRLSGVCYFFKMNSRKEYRSKLSFFTTNILQNVFSLFAVRKCLKAFKVLYIKPGMIIGQIIVSDLKTCRKNYAGLSWNYQKKKSNAIVTQAYQSKCGSWKPPSKARIASDFSTLLVEANFWKRCHQKTDFRWLGKAAHFSTKNPINKPAMNNNKRILIAAVFRFVQE